MCSFIFKLYRWTAASMGHFDRECISSTFTQPCEWKQVIFSAWTLCYALRLTLHLPVTLAFSMMLEILTFSSLNWSHLPSYSTSTFSLFFSKSTHDFPISEFPLKTSTLERQRTKISTFRHFCALKLALFMLLKAVRIDLMWWNSMERTFFREISEKLIIIVEDTNLFET